MKLNQQKDTCPICKTNKLVRSKLILIDSLWEETLETDPRLRYFTDLRLDDVIEKHRSDPPLQQFIEGYYCDQCMKGFASKENLKPSHKINYGK